MLHFGISATAKTVAFLLVLLGTQALYGQTFLCISASMPDAHIQKLAHALRHKGSLVVYSPWTLKDTHMSYWLHIAQKHHIGLIIDPTIFKRHHVTRVPTLLINNKKIVEGVQPCLQWLTRQT